MAAHCCSSKHFQASGLRVLVPIRLILIAAAIAGSYFAAMVFAPFFPGAAWTDPEVVAQNGRPLGLAPQQLVTYVLCSLVVVAILLAVFAP